MRQRQPVPPREHIELRRAQQSTQSVNVALMHCRVRRGQLPRVLSVDVQPRVGLEQSAHRGDVPAARRKVQRRPALVVHMVQVGVRLPDEKLDRPMGLPGDCDHERRAPLAVRHVHHRCVYSRHLPAHVHRVRGRRDVEHGVAGVVRRSDVGAGVREQQPNALQPVFQLCQRRVTRGRRVAARLGALAPNVFLRRPV